MAGLGPPATPPATGPKPTAIAQARSGAPSRLRPNPQGLRLTKTRRAQLQAGFGPHAQEIMADIPNYTDLSPVIQISEVVVG